MTTIPYDVSGRHVAVVGGGRSGLAASRLVMQQRRPRDADRRQGGSGRTRPNCRRSASSSVSVRCLTTCPSDASLVVVSPGVPADVRSAAGRTCPRRTRHRRTGVRRVVRGRADHRDHRLQGQVDDDDAGGPDDRGVRAAGARGRQHRCAALGAGRGVHAVDVARRRDQQLPARDHRAVSPARRGLAQFLAGSPRSTRHRGRLRARQGTHLREPDGRGLGRGARRRCAHPCACGAGRRAGRDLWRGPRCRGRRRPGRRCDCASSCGWARPSRWCRCRPYASRGATCSATSWPRAPWRIWRECQAPT